MSLVGTLARIEAVRTGLAQPRATVRHRHVSDRPMVLVLLTTAGETGAPLGALVGTERDSPTLLVVPQPRDRDLRFAFLADLAEVMLPYLEGHVDDVEVQSRKERDPETGERVEVERELCRDAPQLLVPSGAAIEYIRLLGRSTRFRRTAEQDPDEPNPVPSRVPMLGRWLTHFGERALTPGTSLLCAMTDLLARHWATGQSAVEDQHLGALLAWIDPPPGLSGRQAALHAETERDERGLLVCPPAGPATDPEFDNRVLAPAISRYDAGLPGTEQNVRGLIEGQLRPTWDRVWRGVDLLHGLPAGERVADRWESDRWSYTGQRDRIRSGEPPQPKRDDAVTAAAKLVRRETEQVRLEAQEALDDPLVMAERRLAGEAFAGEVVSVEMAYSEGRAPKPRPLVTVATEDSPHVEPGGRVYRAVGGGRAQEAQVVEQEAGAIVVRLVNQMGRAKQPAEGSVPEPGAQVCFTLFEHNPRAAPPLPDPEDTPWTHGGPPGGAAFQAPDPHTAEDFL